MKRIAWSKYLPVVLASTCLAPVAITPAYSVDPVYVAQVASDYDSYMRLGYAATAKRDYKHALVNFRHALRLRPGDRYATVAIRNVSTYDAGGSGSKIAFHPSGIGAPKTTIGGATRGGGNCVDSTKELTPLVQKNSLEFTTAEYPVILFYVPKNSAQNLEILLRDQDDKEYNASVATPQTPGIVSLSSSGLKDSIGKSLPPLESGKKYSWYLSIICDPQKADTNPVVEVSFERKQIDPVLADELQKADPRDRVSLYTVNGIWYDAVAALYQARQSSPNDSVLANEWAELLKSVKLDEFASEPLVQCCTIRK